MNEKYYFEYHIKHLRACKILFTLYQQYYKKESDELVRNKIYRAYKLKNLDPDDRAIRYEFGIKCTADGLHSMKRICVLEKEIEKIISEYEKYRSIPIFFFPTEVGGINPTRSRVFGDRIDHTLYDLKLYYSDNREACHLIKAYNRPRTKKWLKGMKSFET